MNYCGDCVFWKLDKSKDGKFNGQHRCRIWLNLHTELWEACGQYLGKEDIPITPDITCQNKTTGGKRNARKI